MERKPVKLKDAKPGDYVILRYRGGTTTAPVYKWRMPQVLETTPQSILISSVRYRRTGVPYSRHDSHYRLFDPTDENIAEVAKSAAKASAEAAERKRQADEYQRQRRDSATAAAEWLAGKTADEIRAVLVESTLNDAWSDIKRHEEKANAVP